MAEGTAPAVPTTFPRTCLDRTGIIGGAVVGGNAEDAELERRGMRLLTPGAHAKLDAARARFGGR